MNTLELLEFKAEIEYLISLKNEMEEERDPDDYSKFSFSYNFELYISGNRKNKYESLERNKSWNPNNLSKNNSLQSVQGNNVSSFYEHFRKRS